MERGPAFKLLSHEEFGRLSREEKLAYLTGAVTALKSNVPLAAARPPPPKEENPGS
jgi:hypothetical protein